MQQKNIILKRGENPVLINIPVECFLVKTGKKLSTKKDGS